MIDLHCHLLPGIDDGPDTLEQSLELCRIASADGIRRAVVTPHIHPGRWDSTAATIRRDCQALQRELEAHGIPLRLGYAAEVRVTERVMQQFVADELPFLGEVDGYRILLLEFPNGQLVPGADKLAAWLLRRGVRPLIAHPERNREVMRDPSRLQPLLALGCWLQITGGSMTGAFGGRARDLAHYLLDQDAVAVMASDGHNNDSRQPVLQQACRQVAERYGEDRARRLVQETPAQIIGAEVA